MVNSALQETTTFGLQKKDWEIENNSEKRIESIVIEHYKSRVLMCLLILYFISRLQSLNSEIRTLTKLSRAVRGLPLNRKKYRMRMRRYPAIKTEPNQASEDEAVLNEPDFIEFID